MSSDKKDPIVQSVPPRVRKASEAEPENQAPKVDEPTVVTAPAFVPERPVAAKPIERNPNQGVQFGDTAATMEDFEAMLNADESNLPKRRNFDVGDVVEGTIMSIGRHIFVDLGDRYEGVASHDGYLDDEGNLTLNVGDTLKFYVLSLRGGIQL